MATKIDFTMATAFVSDIRAAKEQVDTYASKLEESLNNLYADWKGDCSDAFKLKSSAYLEYLKNLSKDYETTANQIAAIINEWVLAEEKAKEIGTNRTC